MRLYLFDLLLLLWGFRFSNLFMFYILLIDFSILHSIPSQIAAKLENTIIKKQQVWLD